MRMMLAIFIISMSLSPPYLRVRKLWIAMRRKKKEEKVEHTKLVEPPADTSLSSDKEVSTEAPSFIIIPIETHHEPKSRNHRPKKIFRSKQVGYLRWQNILPECYQSLKKKWWQGLVGHLNDRGKF
jgi:hypothetical protein